MIKNSKDLTKKELSLFQEAYIDYFKHFCIEYTPMPSILNKARMMLLSKKFADESIRRISTDQSVSFTYFSEEELIAFMTGYLNDQGEAVLSHYYNVADGHRVRNLASKELLSALAKALKNKGASTIHAQVAYSDPVLIDTLESLNFTQSVKTDNEVSYEKRI